MGLPKKIKKNIPLTFPKILLPRREQLLEDINRDGTYLPKSLLHADLDRGFLDFVKEQLKVVVEGQVIPTVDILMTTQNWSQFVETWDFQNIDRNVEPPFITTVRVPEVKYGSNPALVYNIPNRRQYFYAQVPTWDGDRHGMDIYKIPQPVPVDITYSVKIICNRMRELNQFNKLVIETFASRQAYRQIKGHYIPIIMNNITDESVMDVGKRKYYIQSYEFTMLGFLIDENEFEVSPAVARVLQMYEFNDGVQKRKRKPNDNPDETNLDVLFVSGNTVSSQLFNYTTNLILSESNNVHSYDIYINNNYYGSDLGEIQVNNGDNVRIQIVKIDDLLEANINFLSILL